MRSINFEQAPAPRMGGHRLGNRFRIAMNDVEGDYTHNPSTSVS
jgi:hypothetical protein